MKKLKLYEEYVDGKSVVITNLLNNMITMFIDTFQGNNDVLGENDIKSIGLVEIDKSITNDAVEKNIRLEFFDNELFYQIFFIVKLDDVEKDKVKTAYLKIKVYNADKITLLREVSKNVELEEATSEQINEEGRFFIKVTDDEGESDYIENYIVSKIGEIKTQFEK
jgi:hypothetical protein